MQNRMWGDEYRTTLICVDSYENMVLAGRMYNPSLPEGAVYKSLIDLIRRMESLLDDMQFPQSFTAARVFWAEDHPAADALPDPMLLEGKLATFAVRVIFRQNASWQGSVTWLEQGREEHFRSILELTILLDSVLQDARGKSRKRAPASPACTA